MKYRSLQSCCILEKEQNGDLLNVWSFPAWKGDRLNRSLALLKDKRLQEHNEEGIFYFKSHDFWVYSLERKEFIILLSTSEFNTVKYGALLTCLADAYLKTYDPTAVLEVYLDNFDQALPEAAVSAYRGLHTLKDLINLFALDVIQIYNALLLKKRLIVYHHNLKALLEWLPVFPRLVSHRDMSDDVWPWIALISPEIKQLQARPYFLAGCTDNSVFTRTELFDVVVNLPAKELTIARHAKDKLQVTKVHKEIAQELEKLAQDESVTEDCLIQKLSNRTQALLDQIESSRQEDGTLALADIKERFSSPTSDFFVQLAECESIRIR